MFVTFLIVTSMHTDGWLVVGIDFKSSFASVTDKPWIQQITAFIDTTDEPIKIVINENRTLTIVTLNR